jgi:hypothetical protein
MNTNTIQVITATISAGLMAGFIGLAVTGNVLVGAAIGVSYLTVAALIAMAVSDYRSGPKAYFAAPVVAGHFQQTVPVSGALRAPSANARKAA